MNTAHDAFIAARDFLLAHRTDYDTAIRHFRWPALTQFNWALDYFDVMAADNDEPALWIVGDDASECKRSFREMSERSSQVANHLRALGLHAPEVHFKDIANGLLVLDDFGDDTYTRLFEKGSDPKHLYELAVDVLVHLHKHPQGGAIDLPKYGDDQLAFSEGLTVERKK